MTLPDIVPTAADRADPVRMAEITAQARREGRAVVHGARPVMDNILADRDARIADGSLPTIKRGDDRAFFDNLGDIARGKKAVT